MKREREKVSSVRRAQKWGREVGRETVEKSEAGRDEGTNKEFP